MTLNQGVDIDLQRELDVSHPRIAEDHTEAVEFPRFVVDLDATAFSPVYLRLNTRFGLVSYSMDLGVRSYLSHKIFYNCIFASKSFFLDLAVNAVGRERILVKPLDDVFSIAIQLAGLP